MEMATNGSMNLIWTEIIPLLAAHIIRTYLGDYAQPDTRLLGEEQLEMKPF
jgi:hypothetical protein